MRPCRTCGATAKDGLFFCPQCGTRLDTPSGNASAQIPASKRDVANDGGAAPTIPSQHPPPMPSGEVDDVPAGSMLDESTRAYGPGITPQAKMLPQQARLRSLVLHPTIAPYVARVASAIRSKRLSVGIVVEIAVLVACADNDVDAGEYTALEDVVSATLGDIDGGVRSGVVDAAIAKLRSSSFDARTRAVGGAVAAAGAAEEALVLAFALAFASNDLSIPERGAIDALAEAMNAPVGALAHARTLVRSVIDAG